MMKKVLLAVLIIAAVICGLLWIFPYEQTYGNCRAEATSLYGSNLTIWDTTKQVDLTISMYREKYDLDTRKLVYDENSRHQSLYVNILRNFTSSEININSSQCIIRIDKNRSHTTSFRSSDGYASGIIFNFPSSFNDKVLETILQEASQGSVLRMVITTDEEPLELEFPLDGFSDALDHCISFTEKYSIRRNAGLLTYGIHGILRFLSNPKPLDFTK